MDPASGLLYVPVGNPAPNFDNSVRQGDNLFTGSVVVLGAKTGAYKNHFQLVPRDWHDWDVSNPPALIKTMGGKRLMTVSPKDGHLYGFDLADDKLLYRTPSLAGLAAIVLGILALAGVNAAVLDLSALIALGATLVMTGSTLSATVMSFMRPATATR